MITVQLLGGASLRSGDTPISGPPAQRHRVALLTLIVASWPQPLSRDRAMAMLWPERDMASGRRLLNLAVHVLRSALGEDVIASLADGLLFNPTSIRCDLYDLRAAIAAHDPEKVVRCYAGPLLAGFHLADSAEFEFWLDAQRNEYARAYTDALRMLAERQEESGDVHAWVGTARRLVAADPHSGLHARVLMRALDAAGDRAGAIQHATEHANRLRTDLELEPDPEVVALAEQLRHAPPKRIQTAGTRQASSPPSVAVLPFLNLSEEKGNEYFADGITEDVIAHLAKIRAINVISLTSVLPFKRRSQSLKEIGRVLGATAMLDGSVRSAGDRVRIVAKLVDVETDRNLWAETYDRQLTDIFTIQTDVALQIAAALKAELSIDEHTRVQKEPTKNLQAYRLFLQGRQSYISFSRESMLHAIELYDRAVARDPTFALAWAHIAIAHTELVEEGALLPDVAFARAHAAATNALRFDPELGLAYCAMGFLKTVSEFDWPAAESCFRRALELSPGSADSYDYYGRMLTGIGRHDEAIVVLERARELDPLAHQLDIVTTLLRAGKCDEALRRAEEAVEELDTTRSRAWATLGWAYFLSGNKEKGISALERAASVPTETTLWLSQLGLAYGMAGMRDKAREIVHQLEERAQTTFVSPYHFAYVYTGLDADRAIDCLERAVAQRSGASYGIKGSFLFAPLREHPRFRALLRRMNLE